MDKERELRKTMRNLRRHPQEQFWGLASLITLAIMVLAIITASWQWALFWVYIQIRISGIATYLKQERRFGDNEDL